MTGSYLLLVSLLTLASVSPSSASSCRLTNFRTSRGSQLNCSCPGSHTTHISIAASVDVGISCLNDCLNSDTTRAACDSGVSATFQQTARAQREVCCSRCGGAFKNGRCNRIFLESRPLPQPVEGCFHKIRETVQGQSYACRCATGLNLEVPFFIASGVDDDCLRRCGDIQNFEEVCKLGEKESDIWETFRFWFELCCGKGCIGRNLDGGFTCGKLLE